MLRIVLVQPGATDFDEQGRIKGSLDIPLSPNGSHQVERTVQELQSLELDAIYVSPSESALQTAAALARSRKVKVKRVEKLKNLDHGLWHGKLIEEVRQKQPKVYRQGQDHPGTVCPPEGESVSAARRRLGAVLAKIRRKHKSGTVALVVPEPLASFTVSELQESDLGDLWKAEQDCGSWQLINLTSKRVALGDN
jgi:probable phosphoglycerate mutase